MLNTNSTGPQSVPTRSVCRKNWNIRLIDCCNRIIHGAKPSSASGSQNGSAVKGTHGWRSAVDRLYRSLEWCTTWLAQKTRTV